MITNFKFFGEFLQKIKKIVTFFKIDFSFLLIFLLAVFLEELSLYFWFVLFVCLHECSHFLVAKKLGYMAKRIHLTFFGASLEGLDDFVLNDEIKIILAGPLFNLAVVVLCYLSFWFYPESYHYLNEILLANWSIFLFNFLPIYPLDLGRILLSFLSKKYNRKDALRKTKNISLCFIILMFAVFIISFFFEFNFTLGFVCVNLAVLNFKESTGTSFKREKFVSHKLKLLSKGLLERNVYVKSDIPHYALFKFIDDYHFFNFLFINNEFDVINSISEVELYKEFGFIN